MNIIQSGDLGVVSTKESFVIIVKGKIYGPFPSTIEMYENIIKLFEGDK